MTGNAHSILLLQSIVIKGAQGGTRVCSRGIDFHSLNCKMGHIRRCSRDAFGMVATLATGKSLDEYRWKRVFIVM